MQQALGLSQRHSCRITGWGRSTIRYRSTAISDDAVRTRLRELASAYPRDGYRRLGLELRREGLLINHKRVLRLYREEGLMLRRTSRKRRAAGPREPLRRAERCNQRWAMDFMSDTLADGKTFRLLCILDEHTRECPAIEVGHSLPAGRVIRVVERIVLTRGVPEEIVMDNGPEFRSRQLDVWATQKGVRLRFIEPGKPIQNAFIESFQGKVRDECLNQHWFDGLDDARRTIESWRRRYNTWRPHSSLGNIPPADFAARAGLRASPPRSAQRAHQVAIVHPGRPP